MVKDNAETVPATGKRVKILLVVSLGLNMLIIGAAGGMVFANKNASEWRPNLRDISYGPFTRALSREDRTEIGAAMRQEAGTIQQALPKTRENYRALLTALQADVYDKDAVHKLVNTQLAIGLRRQQIGQRLFLERLDAMSAAQRQKFAKRLQRALKRLNG